MAINITVEDGTGVANANSFITIDEAKTYASDRGVDLGANDELIKAYMVNATDYLNTFSNRYLGWPTYGRAQGLPFPREGIHMQYVGYLPKNEVPVEIKRAQSQLVIEQKNGIILMPSTAAGSPGPVILEKVDVITTQYANPGASNDWTQPEMPLVDAILVPFLNVGFFLRTLRI